MSFLDQMKGLLSQYTSGTAPAGDPAAHFQQVAQSVDSGTLAQGIAAAMRSDQTPPFAQIVSQLFSNGSSDQKAAMLNTLLSAVPAGQRSQLAAIAPALAGATHVRSEGMRHEYAFDAIATPIPELLAAAAVRAHLVDVETHRAPIEDMIADLYRDWRGA